VEEDMISIVLMDFSSCAFSCVFDKQLSLMKQ